MAKLSRTPVTQVQNATPVAPVAPVAQVPAPVAPAATAAAIAAKPYGSWTADEKRWMAEYEKQVAKAHAGGLAYLGLSDDGRTISIDINVIDQSHPNAKKAQDGRPYLFAVDGQQFTANGVKYNLSAIYALRSK